jgi:hypothetical protein
MAKVGICSVDDCYRTGKAKKMCSMHYQRMCRNGTITPKTYPKIEGTPEQKFWSKVAVTANPSKCWNWLASTHTESGYGQVALNGRQSRAHRAAWFYAYGKHPSQNLLHSCDNRLCVNPDHLREGTQKENYRDAVDRGRMPQIKLSEADVLNIRSDLRSSTIIGATYGISARHARKVRRRKAWPSVLEVAV